MNLVIRKSVFETNSSTCHTIAITKKFYNKENAIYPWEFSNYEGPFRYSYSRGLLKLPENITDKIAFAYMSIMCYLREQLNDDTKVISQLEDIEKLISDEVKNIQITHVPGSQVKDSVDQVHILLKIIREYTLENASGDTEYGKYFSIDHVEETFKFAKACLEDREKLMRFIFDNDSYFAVAGDEYQGHYVKRIGFEYDYDSEEEFYDKCKTLEDKYEFFY